MSKRTLIIAEAGVNHNGSKEIAMRMIDEAKDCGADIVKFQTGPAQNVVSRYAQKAAYQKQTTGGEESQLEMIRKLELSFDEFRKLKDYCDHVGIEFLSTPFDLESVEFLNGFSMPFWKIPSGEITNLPYLLKIGATGKPVVMSTGMAEMNEIADAMEWLKKAGCPDIKLLQCNTEYPTPYQDVNLSAMQTLRETFHVETGYSDHTRGIEAAIAAAAMGAVIIEKHFTLDRNMKGPDHAASLEPEELKQMTEAIRHVDMALGNGIKTASPSEQKNRDVVRKSIVAKKAIRRGELFTEENLTTKRPGNGVSPMKWFDVLGQKSIRDYEEDELIDATDRHDDCCYG